jgi:hypothetical protein
MSEAHRRGVECLVALAFGLTSFAVLMPWPRSSPSLRTCPLTQVGRFGVQCDLAALAEHTGKSWLRGGVRVDEDGVRLREADPHRGPANGSSPPSMSSSRRRRLAEALLSRGSQSMGTDSRVRPRAGR